MHTVLALWKNLKHIRSAVPSYGCQAMIGQSSFRGGVWQRSIMNWYAEAAAQILPEIKKNVLLSWFYYFSGIATAFFERLVKMWMWYKFYSKQKHTIIVANKFFGCFSCIYEFVSVSLCLSSFLSAKFFSYVYRVKIKWDITIYSRIATDGVGQWLVVHKSISLQYWDICTRYCL